MISTLAALTRYGVAALAIMLLTLLAARIYDAERGAPLKPWHLETFDELGAEQLDASNWDAYLAAEERIFQRLRTELTDQLEPEDRVAANRYDAGSPLYPGRFKPDWNRSYRMTPSGSPKGAVVLLHGLTDSPYSLRHVARLYRDHGYVAIGIRLPAHGTVPAALTKVNWEDWLAATRLAVREARRASGGNTPLHLVGYSNGGALALKYALDALGDQALAKPDRLILISPMIGLTRFAGFAGLAGLPALLPAFAKSAWLSIIPEYNPFKYNSFPVNAARQAHRLTVALQQRIARYAQEGRLGLLPPVQTFQSVMDSTVTTQSILSALYAHLPANGSELILFDINRTAEVRALFREEAETKLTRILPPLPRQYRTALVTNATTNSSEVVARTVESGATEEWVQTLGLRYPADVYSLSHVALPFPPDDALYGTNPTPSEDFGLHLGTVASRGERGALITSLDALLRVSCNPFFDYLAQRIEQGIP